jgi:2-desacetyl-2-hydroxyethyl bacteriochlorophyllide A dehydrogenase
MADEGAPVIPDLANVYYLTGPRQLELRPEPLPSPGPNDVVCATSVTAISPGTELAAYRGLPPLRPGTGYPRLQGYCNVARVILVGDRVEGLSVGDRVLTHQSHRSHFLLPASDVLLRLPAEAGAQDIVCTYLYHLGYNAVIRSDVRAGSRVLVIGLGVLGLTAVAAAALAGAVVAAVTDHEVPARVAKASGALVVCSRSEVSEQPPFPDEGADVVITTTSSWADWDLALAMAECQAVVGRNRHANAGAC